MHGDPDMLRGKSFPATEYTVWLFGAISAKLKGSRENIETTLQSPILSLQSISMDTNESLSIVCFMKGSLFCWIQQWNEVAVVIHGSVPLPL